MLIDVNNLNQEFPFFYPNFLLFFNVSDFEQEAGYPKQEARFLDLSIRGLCKDDYGKLHNIEKQLMIGKII